MAGEVLYRWFRHGAAERRSQLLPGCAESREGEWIPSPSMDTLPAGLYGRAEFQMVVYLEEED